MHQNVRNTKSRTYHVRKISRWFTFVTHLGKSNQVKIKFMPCLKRSITITKVSGIYLRTLEASLETNDKDSAVDMPEKVKIHSNVIARQAYNIRKQKAR